MLNELISPLVTPFILFFWLRPRALDIVDFYRNYTAEVSGVGDVCAFSMMNLRKNGNPAWRSPELVSPATPSEKLPQVDQAENGKIEMSLLSFSVRNPTWDPVDTEAKEFVDEIIAKTRQTYQSTHESVVNPVRLNVTKLYIKCLLTITLFLVATTCDL